MEPDSNDTLLALIRSRIAITQVDTHEETRILAFLKEETAQNNAPLFIWTITDGLRKYPDQTPIPQTIEFQDALKNINTEQSVGLFVMLDIKPHLESPVAQRLIKEIAENYAAKPRTLLFFGRGVQLPDDISRLSARFVPGLPDHDRIHDIYVEEAYRWLTESRKKHGRLETPHEAENMFLLNLSGLAEEDVRRLASNAIRDDGRISEEDVKNVLKFKHQALGKDGLIEFYPDTSNFGDVGGLDGLKAWLEVRRAGFVSTDDALDADQPKGVLLLGVQGSGKSLAARAVAGTWHVPLMRLDFGALYNKYIGESERNVRDALSQAEAMAPCVLWIDEIEKGLASDGNGSADGGVSRRLLGTVLTWMAEHTARVFLVATANDVSQLPPELMRKGRIDEIFFLDLPSKQTREDIFRIHLKKRALEPDKFDLAELANLSFGFSGAEIEQVVISGIYAARALGKPLHTGAFAQEISKTKPLSVVMSEKVTALRKWAEGRTVSASTGARD